MPLSNSPSGSIRWLLSEVTIVVAGILMAFSIDSWWQGVEDRQIEQTLLRSLAIEFESNQQQLESKIQIYRLRTTAAETLLDLHSRADPVNSEAIEDHWKWITRAGSYDPSTAVLDAAISSGAITVLQDLDLQVALAEWPAKVQNFSFVEDIVSNLIINQLIPWMRTATALPNNSFGELGLPDSRSETDYQLLASSIVIENFLREMVAWGRILEEDVSELEGSFVQVNAGISRNLE